MAFIATRQAPTPPVRSAQPLRLFPALALAACLALATSAQTQEVDSAIEQGKEAAVAGPTFTSEVLPVLYVKDVLKSVEYYRDSLGFAFDSYYDYELGEPVTEWVKDTPAIYASMRAGEQKFALHRPGDPDTLHVGGFRHYFGVEDVRAHHERLKALEVEVSEIFVRPWMTMFAVNDLDGHVIFFFTRPE